MPELLLKKPITSESLDQNQAAWVLGVTYSAVRKWLELEENPIPSKGEGVRRRFNIREIIIWHEEYKESRWKNAREGKAAKESQYLEEKEAVRRIKSLKAEEQQIKNDILLDKYVRTDLILTAFAGVIAQTKTDFLSLPNRLRGAFGNDVYDESKKLVHKILTNLSAKVKSLNNIKATVTKLTKNEET